MLLYVVCTLLTGVLYSLSTTETGFQDDIQKILEQLETLKVLRVKKNTLYPKKNIYTIVYEKNIH